MANGQLSIVGFIPRIYRNFTHSFSYPWNL